MKDGQLEATKKLLLDPAWKGAAYYNAGDYQQAINTLSSIEHPTPKQQYNLVNAYAKHGDLQKAIDLYEQVLKTTPMTEMHTYNLDVVKSALKQQQQQQQQQTAAATATKE
ncbi:tetratricopeptide repeat protein [Vibrio sp. PP-XX7]